MVHSIHISISLSFSFSLSLFATKDSFSIGKVFQKFETSYLEIIDEFALQQ